MRTVIFLSLLLGMLGRSHAEFEVLAVGYLSLTQHKNASKSMRLEGAVSSDKPGVPTFVKTNGSNANAQNAASYDSSSFESTDLRDSISSTRDVVYDSDGNRNVVPTNIFTSATGGGGGGCLLK